MKKHETRKPRVWRRWSGIMVVAVLVVSTYAVRAETITQKPENLSSEGVVTDSAFFGKNVKVKSRTVAAVSDQLPSELPLVKKPDKELEKWSITYWWDKADWPASVCYSEGIEIWLCSPQWITSRSVIQARDKMKTAAQANEEWRSSIAQLWENSITIAGYFSFRPSRDMQEMRNLDWNVFLLSEDGNRIAPRNAIFGFDRAVFHPGDYQSGVVVAGVYVPGVNMESYYYVPFSFMFDRIDGKGKTLLNAKTKNISLCIGSSLCQVRFQWQFKK